MSVIGRIAIRRMMPLGFAMCGLGLILCTPAQAQRLDNKVAVFAALDKVTATIKKLEVPVGEAAEFGALKVKPKVCYSRHPTEQPKTSTFVEVEETLLDGSHKRLFTGWMFAESPGLNAVEHPVFDVWLTGCDEPKNAPAEVQGAAAKEGDGNAEGQPQPRPRPRRRVRR